MKKYFYGNAISDYGMENGFVDYATLAKSINHVLCNGLFEDTHGYEQWELYSGFDYDEEEDRFIEFYQYYITDEAGAKILEEAGETVWYNADLDLYLWGVTHWGTSWDYVLTSIKIDW